MHKEETAAHKRSSVPIMRWKNVIKFGKKQTIRVLVINDELHLHERYLIIKVNLKQ